MSMSKKRMGRPPKPEGERKDVDLRIPVTHAQKAIIVDAVQTTGIDMASWARMVLLDQAAKMMRKK